MKFIFVFLFLFGSGLTQLVQAREQSTLVIATHIEPPLIYLQQGEFNGPNAEIAKLLAASINKTAVFVQCPFARCLYMAKAGRADMLIGINKNAERMAYLDYLATPYTSISTPINFYLNTDNLHNITKHEDLANLTIGVVRGATIYPKFNQDKSLKTIEVSTHEQLIEMLLKQRIDTFAAKDLSIRARVPRDIYQNKMQMADYSYHKQADFYIAVSKKSPLNLDHQQLSQHLALLLNNGTIERLLNKKADFK